MTVTVTAVTAVCDCVMTWELFLLPREIELLCEWCTQAHRTEQLHLFPVVVVREGGWEVEMGWVETYHRNKMINIIAVQQSRVIAAARSS